MLTTQKVIPIFRIFDLAKAKEFYVDYLGFKLDWEHHFEENTPAYIQASLGDLILHLSEHHGDCCPGSTAFVEVRDLVAFHKQLTEKRYKYLNPGIEIAFWNAKYMQLIDPFGNRLRFSEPIAA